MLKKILATTLIIIGALSARGTDFMLVNGKKPLHINIDKGEKSVVRSAAEMFCGDITLVSGGVTPIVGSSFEQNSIIVGTIGESKLIENLIIRNNISTNDIAGKWEAFKIVNLDNSVVAVIGSDARGTAYGILELSRMAGVSPWVWWADVTPNVKTKVTIPSGFTKCDQPSVQYRGIFLNDEDWGLVPWSSMSFEPSQRAGEIGAKTYAKIFELLLRLRANTIWPAMHEKTVPFYMVDGAKEAADRYGIVVGTSHCEPLMRNNAGEWNSSERGAFNFLTNRENIVTYWSERLDQVKGKENFYTIGMRGVHDGKMEGVNTIAEYKSALIEVIECQRQLLATHINPEVEKIPQAIIPYKEVLEVYDAGLEVPEDVTLVWCDDNYGYLTRLSNETEQKRSGGSGVYYHISYWGRPHDYLWLCSTPPAQIYNEMKKAWDYGAQKLWIANVGDIKPAEYDIEFFLDLAWNINCVNNSNIDSHLRNWATREFGVECAENLVTPVMSEYYALAAVRKPEHTGWNQVEVSNYPGGKTPVSDSEWNPFAFSDEIKTRVDRYKMLEEKMLKNSETVPINRQDAFFQLVKYPVLSALAMNKKMLYAQKARIYAAHDLPVANAYTVLSIDAYTRIKRLTETYNKSIAGAKWDRIMDMAPRSLPVFAAPKIPQYIDYQKDESQPIVWCENHEKPLAQGETIAIPTFVKEADNKYFILLFSKNMRKPKWDVYDAPLWLNYKEEVDEFRDETRIVFSVNWKVAKAANIAGRATLIAGGVKYPISISTHRAQVTASGYEANGAVAINAANFASSSTPNIKQTNGLGHSQKAISLPKGETMEYKIYTTTSSPAEIRVYLLPTQAVEKGGDVSISISIDNEEPTQHSIKTPFRSEVWKQNVLRNQAIVKRDHTFSQQGVHTLKITALDNNIVLDQIMIDFQNSRKFYEVPTSK